MEWKAGQIVQSRKGRDVTRRYVVLGCDGERLLLANGQKFTLENPKRKNPRHVNPTAAILPRDKIADNPTIAKALAALAVNAPEQGG